ncbi:MAG: anti-sigma factor [Gemmatimonadales bacterium]
MSDWIGMTPAPRAPRPELKQRVLERALAARPWSPWAIAAAAVLVLAVGASGVLWRRGTRLEERLTATRDTLDLLRGPGTRVVTIPVATGTRVGVLTIFADTVAHRWLVTCHNFAPNAPDQAYQLWFVTERGMRSAALMVMDHDAPMIAALDMPSDAGTVMGVAMSVEGKSGSREPSGPMLFHVDL